jgi:Uma2 family endonuclease
MAVMPVIERDQAWLPHDGEWTVDDLETLPDDGLQYELFDGVLVVSPAPVPRHQRAILGLAVLLRAACPPELEVFVAPLDFQPTRRRSFQPDVLVARRDRIGEKNIVHPPVLAVEVLSPSTRAKDLVLYPAFYASSGVAYYWTFNPKDPELIAYELVGEKYRETARVAGDETLTLKAPFPVEICPSAISAG